jgi:hypothetical protein
MQDLLKINIRINNNPWHEFSANIFPPVRIKTIVQPYHFSMALYNHPILYRGDQLSV